MNVFQKRYAEWGFPQKQIEHARFVRVNTLKPEILQCDAKLTKVSYLPNGFIFEANFSPASTPQYLLGQLYPQEAASQIPALFLEVEPTHTVLDMCAAPGSKTTQLAAIMENKGVIVAVDIQRNRCETLTKNLERCGVINTIVKNMDATDMLGQFDRILLDAPCSGNFITDPKWFDKRQVADFTERSALQRQLLKKAIRLLKPGGILIYSTCSLEKEENEDVVEAVMDKIEEVKLVPIDLDKKIARPGLTERTKNCIRLWPSISGTQGFFMAKFVKDTE